MSLFWSGISGNWDVKTQVPHQCSVSKLKLPPYFMEWINLKDVYQNFYNPRNEVCKLIFWLLRFHNTSFIILVTKITIMSEEKDFYVFTLGLMLLKSNTNQAKSLEHRSEFAFILRTILIIFPISTCHSEFAIYAINYKLIIVLISVGYKWPPSWLLLVDGNYSFFPYV